MAKQSPYDRLIGLFYDAAAEPERWNQVMDELGRWMGGVGGQYAIWDKCADAFVFGAQNDAAFAPGAGELYGQYYYTIDPRGRQIIDDTQVGEVYCCHHHYDDRYASRSEFYNDFLIPIGSRYIVAAKVMDDGEMLAITAAHRNPRQGPFDADAEAKFRRLLPHLGRAARLHCKLVALERANTAFERLVDGLAYGVAVVDAAARLLFSNEPARCMLRAEDGLRLRGGRLTAEHPAENQALQQQIKEAVETASGHVCTPRGFVTFRRPSGLRPYAAMAAPLTAIGARRWIGEQPAAIVFLSDPELIPTPPMEAVVKVLGLTPAEARLALGLAEGKTVNEIAETRGLSRNTIRVQLQSIFSKLGVRRQVELILLLSQLPDLTNFFM